jgi:uncharacterized protein involved in exopolysaccharide biosynthesis
MNPPAEKLVALSPLWNRIRSHRSAILILTGVALLVGVALALFLPPWYRAETSLLPPSEGETGFGLVSLLRGIAVPGITIPTQATPADVFLAVLDSRRINDEIVQRFNLRQLYHRKFMEDAVRELKRHARFKLTEAGTIVISVEDRSAQRAADIANAYVDLLDHFNREVRMTKGRRTRLFIESRIADTHRDLVNAEEALATFQSQHKTMGLSPEKSAAVEAAAELYAQRAALQVRLGVVQSYSRARTDEEVQIEQRLQQLDQQLEKLPVTGLQQARLLRDVKTLEQVYVLLSAQYEEARIDEARNVTTVELLDAATPPERRSRPRRALVVALSGILGGAVGITYALLRRDLAPPTSAPSVTVT